MDNALLWAYIIIVLVGAIIFGLFIGRSYSNSLFTFIKIPNGTLNRITILFIEVIFILGLGIYIYAYHDCNQAYLNILLLAHLISMIGFSYQLYIRRDAGSSLIFLIAALIFIFMILIHLMIKKPRIEHLFLLIYIAWLAYLIVINIGIISLNPINP